MLSGVVRKASQTTRIGIAYSQPRLSNLLVCLLL